MSRNTENAERSRGSRPAADLLTTGEAAKLCAVTPDTVLKWIKAGKLHAQRTVGGHNRIPRGNLIALDERRSGRRTIADGQAKEFRFCWEFYSDGDALRTECRECLVYRSQATRCFEMSHLPPGSGYKGAFCDVSCNECEYYQRYRPEPIRVLVVTNSTQSGETLRESNDGQFEFRFTNCEYDCSALVGSFRPECVIVDCTLGTEECAQLCAHLSQDPRLREGKVLLATPVGQMTIPEGAAAFPRIAQPVTCRSLHRRIEEVWSPLAAIPARSRAAIATVPCAMPGRRDAPCRFVG
jgi:excisionase family DNA binding protein